VKLPSRYVLIGIVGLWAAHPLPAEEPGRLPVEPGRVASAAAPVSSNQQVAEMIAEHLRQSGQLHHYTIGVIFQDGTAQLTGMVPDPLQRDEALRIVQGIPGVERVRDNLLVGNGVRPAQAADPQLPESLPTPGQVPPSNEPVPIMVAPPPSYFDLNPPRMPPYAWPTYAPYNNVSRVAYPNLYPYEAWPFIGPVYPFPKIPLGWRSVKLTWEDGHWWYSRHSNHYDWWRLRYW
jgi:hypothetical protein